LFYQLLFEIVYHTVWILGQFR